MDHYICLRPSETVQQMPEFIGFLIKRGRKPMKHPFIP